MVRTRGDASGRRSTSRTPAQEIALRELSAICHAVGKLRVADTDELHSIPMKVTLGIEKANTAEERAEGLQAGSQDLTGRRPETVPAGTTKPRGPWA